MARPPSNQLSLFGSAEPPPRAAERQTPVQLAAAALEWRDLGAQLPAAVHLGTSSWSFPGWHGIVYDRQATTPRLSRQGLRAYSQHPLLRTVGIDRTYYVPVNAAVFADYADQVPAPFRFLIKAHEACTMARYPQHERYGAQRGQRNELFLHPGYAAVEVVGPCIEGLKEKAGPLLFQFAPQDIAAMGGAGGFPDRLHAFLAALPRGPLYTVELRSPDLLTPRYFEALQAANAHHCLNWHPSMPPIEQQAQLQRDSTAASDGPLIVRWMLARHRAYDEARQVYAPFAHLAEPDPDARRQIAGLGAAASRRGRQVFVIINNKAEGSAPLSAFELARSITALLHDSDATNSGGDAR